MSDVEKRVEQWREALAGSELLGSSDVHELETHLREEIEHLRTSGLSDEEAFLIARRRLGEPGILGEEFAKVHPHRRFTHRLSWMAAGVLGYFLLQHLGKLAMYSSALLGRALGLSHRYAAVIACIIQVVVLAGIGAMVLRYHTSRRRHQTAYGKMPSPIRTSLFAACAIVAMYWIEVLFGVVMARTMQPWDFVKYARVQAWASLGWSMLMPFLIAGLIVILARRDQRRAQTS